MTLNGVPPRTKAVFDVGATFGRLIVAPGPRTKAPVPLAASAPLEVFGLSAMPALAPVAVIGALTLTLFAAVRVSVEFALQVTASLTLMLPEPATAP